MKSKDLLLNLMIGGFVTIASSGVANATLIDEISDFYEDDSGGPVELNSSESSYGYTHTLEGFNGDTDTIDSASITINLTDDKGSELIEISIGEADTTTIQNIGAKKIFSATIPSLADLQEDGGMLDVTLTSESWHGRVGNFFFIDSTLVAQVTREGPADNFVPTNNGDVNPTQVPEPTTLVLLSLGILGLGFTRRRM
jgi:hypothetical protein